MTKFQVGVGPSMTLAHIRQIGAPTKLSLCKSTNVVRDYKADFSFSNPKLCKRCVKEFKTINGDNPVTAEILGVSEIVE